MLKNEGGTDDETKNPGGARFGNFINYYEFNPPQERLSHLPQDLIERLVPSGGPVHILDIGCNAGNLTKALSSKYQSSRHDVRALGVDIDDQLIQRANGAVEPDNLNLTFRALDVMEEEAQEAVRTYLKENNRTKFDLICLFSVTMWIHLHHGDEGLGRLISCVAELGHHVLLEPQPWRCYQTAARRMRKLGMSSFPALESLTLRGETLENGMLDLCRDVGLVDMSRFGETKWKRKLILFKSEDTKKARGTLQ